METTKIANTGIEASRIGLGTWAIGGKMWGGTNEEDSIKTIHAALDKGISLIDTAPAYGLGESEELVGKAVEQYGGRNNIVLSTKAGLNWTEEGGMYRDASEARIKKEVEDSLRRLRSDHIDVYHVHWPDPEIDMEETASAMKKLFDEGKIRAIGLSNFTPEQIDAFQETAPVHILQPPYNIFERGIEEEVLPYTRKHDITNLSYGSLCRGLLSGKMSADRTFKGDDLRNNDPKFQEDTLPNYIAAVNELDQYVQNKYNKRVIHLAIRWVLDQPGSDIALWGSRRPDQLDPVEESMGWKLDDTDHQAVNEIVDKHIKEPIGPEFMAPPAKSK